MNLRALAPLVFASACGGLPATIHPDRVADLHGTRPLPVDTSPKEAPRLMPTEAWLRSYLALFGGLTPLDAQNAARGRTGAQLFDTWDDYLGALGLPDYRGDLPRGTQTNALMLATFERLGIALCDRAVEHDLRARPALPATARAVFTFDLPADPRGGIDDAAFAARFDQLHRRFLGYPAALAPTHRTQRFLALYRDVAARHAAARPPAFGPAEAGWAAVCYGLVRHPEFNFY